MRSGPEGTAVEMNSAARRGRRTARGYGRLVTWLVSGALLIAFASYVALPFGLGLYLPRLAAQYGIGLDVKRVRVEPFASRLRLSGVRIATTGDSSIEWSSVEARVDLAELLSGRLVLDGFRLSEAKLHAGDPGAEEAGPLPDVPVSLPETLSVGELVIDEVELASMSETLGRPVAIDRLRVSSLNDVFRPEGAEIEADVSIGKGRSRLRGRLAVDAADWNLDAEVGANDVPLDGLPALFGAEGSWRGRVDGSGPVRLVYAPGDGAVSVTVSGRWAVDDPELGLEGVRISGARADWDGAVFMTVSDGTVDALSGGAEVGLHELRVDVDDVLQAETAELTLRVDTSQAHEARLSVAGRSPTVRISAQGGMFDAIDAEAVNLDSQVELTFGDDDGVGIEVERLASNALAARLADGRTIDVERIGIERAVVEPGTNAVSVAAATAERAGWRGFTAPAGAGTATRLTLQGIELHDDGGLRAARASAETIEDRNGDAFLSLRDVALDSATLSPAGASAAGGVRVAEAWRESDAGTLILERLSLDGVEQDEGGAVGIASGRVHVAERTLAGGRAVVGSGLEFTGATVSGGGWEAAHVHLGRADVDTGVASSALHALTLVDAAGEGEGGTARLAWLDKLEHESGGNRVVLDGLHAESPAWRDGAGNAQAVEVAAATLDTLGRRAWESSGWHLTGVEAAASGGASAAAATLESLGLYPAGGSTAGAQRIEFGELAFDGGSTVRAASVLAERTYYRADDGIGIGIDVAGLDADVLEWNGETLVAARGGAPLLSVTAPPMRASFDSVAFTSALLGAGGVHRIGSLASASGRGHVERLLEWSAGALALDGYRAPVADVATLDFIEIRDVDVAGSTNEAHLRTGRLTAREARIEPSGVMVFASAQASGVTLDGVPGGAGTGGAGTLAGTSADALRASPLAIRESGVEIGALSLFGLESTIGVDERGGWELPVFPAPPARTGEPRSSLRVRIEEASTAEPGSVVRLIDRTTDPDFMVVIDVTSAALRGFDSEAIDVPARFSVEAAGGAFTALQARGLLTPTLTGTDLDLNATIQGLSLPRLSPYSRLHFGRPVEGGHADVTVVATVRTSDLEGIADFTVSDLALGESEPPAGSGSPGAGPVEASAFDAALGLLEDERGRIVLKASLRGKLDAPGFDLDGLLARALAAAVLETAQSTPKAE